MLAYYSKWFPVLIQKQGYILCISIISPTLPPLRLFFFSVNKVAGGGAKRNHTRRQGDAGGRKPPPLPSSVYNQKSCIFKAFFSVFFNKFSSFFWIPYFNFSNWILIFLLNFLIITSNTSNFIRKRRQFKKFFLLVFSSRALGLKFRTQPTGIKCRQHLWNNTLHAIYHMKNTVVGGVITLI